LDPASTGSAFKIARDGRVHAIMLLDSYSDDPAWSPDGRRALLPLSLVTHTARASAAG
jgi:hypothetical protein